MLYHNVDHSIMVTMVGLEIIRGKHLYEGRVSPADALNYLSGLCFVTILVTSRGPVSETMEIILK